MFLKLSLLTFLVAVPGLLTSAENVLTCDGDVQRLSCDSGLINVQSAQYGRTSTDTCRTNRTAAQVNSTTCRSTVTSLTDRCNGATYCEFKTNLLNSTDSCPGISKYYNTTYSCISGRTNVICEDSYSTISCGTNTIQILNAKYGRSDPTTCSSGLARTLIQNTTCNSSVRAKVSTLCNGKNSCILYASSTNFTDPCPGTAKYLTVSYSCPSPLKQALACEGSNATLTCGNHTIKVDSANYGRTDSTTCSDGKLPDGISRTNCYKTDSLVRVVNSCNGKNTCVVPATNQFFTDPCYGVYKFLKISYRCV